MLQSALILSAVAFGAVDAHMSIWTRSMFGVGWKANGANLDFEYLGQCGYRPTRPKCLANTRSVDVQLEIRWLLSDPDGHKMIIGSGAFVFTSISCRNLTTNFPTADRKRERFRLFPDKSLPCLLVEA